MALGADGHEAARDGRAEVERSARAVLDVDRSCRGARTPRRRRRLVARRSLDPAHLADVLVASDPGLTRLHLAARATASAGLAALVLALVGARLGQPTTGSLLGIVVAMMSTVLVQDPDPSAAQVTFALMLLPAVAAFLLGTWLAPHLVLGSVVFVAVMFFAAFVRRFGPRGTALGMIGFFSYFYALFFRARVAALPWLMASLGIAMACAFVVRFGLLRDVPERTFRRTLSALHARIRVLLGQLADALEEARPLGTSAFLRRGARLNETALELESQLDRVGAGAIRTGLEQTAVRAHVFDAELAAERVVTAATRLSASCEAPSAERGAGASALRAAERALRRGGLRSAGAPEGAAGMALARRAGKGASPELRWLALSLHELELVGGRLDPDAPAPRHVPESAPSGSDAELDERGTVPGIAGKLAPTTRHAVQVAVAGGLAMIAGRWVSEARWYWAVIAAFVVFTRTTSSGETLVKAWHRVLGTVVGVVAGLLIAELVRGHATLEVTLLFVCVFFAYYLLGVAYGWMIAFFTATLALFYELLGRSPPGIMELRLAETLVGAMIGAAVALFVLPTPTAPRVRRARASVLRELGALLELTASRLVTPGEVSELRAHARALDAKVRTLRSVAGPLTSRVVPIGVTLRARNLALVSALAYHARNLAIVASRASDELAPSERARLGARAERLARAAHSLADAAEADGGRRATAHVDAIAARAAVSTEPVEWAPIDPGAAPAPAALVAHVLRRMEGALAELAIALTSRGARAA